MSTSINERIHFFIKYNLSHFIFERVMFVVCEKWAGDGDSAILTHIFSYHRRSPSSSWLGLLNDGSLRAESPLSAAGSHFGILSPTNSNRSGYLVILLSYIHLLLLCFPLFTQVHLLIESSVEVQYITIWVFPISVCSWSFTGVWVTASLLKSPGLISVFWPFLIVE